MLESAAPVPARQAGVESLASALDRLCADAPRQVLMRHKRAGIWQSWTRHAFADMVHRQAGVLAARGVGQGSRVAIIGENRPELYSALMAAQALGADVMPLGEDFLRRFGQPDGGASLAIAENAASARWWPGESLLLADLEAGRSSPVPSWSADPGRILLHDDGRTADPALLSHDLASLTAEFARLLPGGGKGCQLISFLPLSSVEDAALSLAAPLVAGAVVNCVEGPATFLLDLHDVAPDALVGPARMWDLLDRDISRRLGGGRDVIASASRPAAGFTFTGPLRNAMGLSRCRITAVSSGVVSDGVLARLNAIGLGLRNRTPIADDSRIEAALGDAVVIDRACVWQGDDGMQAEIAVEPTEAARLMDDGGVEALSGAIAAAARKAGVTGWTVREAGFAPHELTLMGEPRHYRAPPPPVPAAARAVLERSGRTDEVLMEAQNVSVSFGGVRALSDVSMEVRRGEILSIIGPNGAGKTSFLNTLNGVYTPREGRIIFQGRTLSRMKPAEAAASGIGRTFQHVALFPGLNVIDNIVAGRAGKTHGIFPFDLVARGLRLPSVVRQESAQRAAAEAILDFLDLTPIRYREVSTLPYGVQKRVELGRALAAEPGILLLDEPMAGMTHEEKQDMVRFIRAANAELGTTVVLIEHDIGVVMGLSDRVVVLNYGSKIADGSPAEVRANPEVIRAYLGADAATESLES